MVLVRNGEVLDLTAIATTASGLFEIEDLAERLSSKSDLPVLGTLDSFLSGEAGRLLAPIDLQAISFFAAPKKKYASLDEVDPELLKTYAKLGIPLQDQEILAGVGGDRAPLARPNHHILLRRREV